MASGGGLKIDVDIDVRRITRDIRKINQKLIPKITAQVLNKTNKGIRTDLVRRVSQTLGIRPMRRVRRRILITRASQATKSRLSAGGLTLFNYVPESYLVGSGKKALRAASGRNKFAAKMKTGHVGLYSRTAGDDSLPIRQHLVDVGQRVQVIADALIENSGRKRFIKEFERQIARRLSR